MTSLNISYSELYRKAQKEVDKLEAENAKLSSSVASLDAEIASLREQLRGERERSEQLRAVVEAAEHQIERFPDDTVLRLIKALAALGDDK